MKRCLVFLLLIIPLALLSAQADVYNIFSVDIGYNIMADSGTPPLEYFLSIGLNARVTERISAGVEINFLNFVIPINVNILKFKIDIIPPVRAVLGFMPPITPFSSAGALGIGLELLPVRRRTGGLSTEFKLFLDFLHDLDFTAASPYSLRFGLAMGIGH